MALLSRRREEESRVRGGRLGARGSDAGDESLQAVLLAAAVRLQLRATVDQHRALRGARALWDIWSGLWGAPGAACSTSTPWSLVRTCVGAADDVNALTL